MAKRRAAADVFQAIADPTRRRLLDLLREGEQKVTDLAGRFAITLPGVSQHLRLLREAGLVRVRRAGRERYYRVNARPLRRVAEWVAFYEQFWRQKLDALDEHLKGSMSDIRIERTYPYSPERVWQALTDPEALAAWLMANDFRPEVGHKFQFRAKPQPGWRGIVDCEVLEVDPPRRLSYTWQGDPKYRPTIVTWVLEPAEGGTRLRLEHTGFRGLGGFFLKLLLGGGWKKMLRTSLVAVLGRLTDKGLPPAAAAEIRRDCH